MARQNASTRMVAGAISLVGLASVWMAIVTSLPSQEELSALQAVQRTLATAPVRTAAASVAASSTEPILDLSIPGVAPVPPASGQLHEQDRPAHSTKDMTGSAASDPRTAQVIRLKCEAEIHQLCPDAVDGQARARCLEHRAKDLPTSCQNHLRERFVKWKEDRSRMMSACQEDVRRFCTTTRLGDGQVMRCLQEHAQEVSDRCYQTLPKGTLLFR